METMHELGVDLSTARPNRLIETTVEGAAMRFEPASPCLSSVRAGHRTNMGCECSFGLDGKIS
jgi:hypothetical protein